MGKLSDLTPTFENFPIITIFNDFELTEKEIDIVLSFDDFDLTTSQNFRKRGSLLKRGISKVITSDMMQKSQHKHSQVDNFQLKIILNKLSTNVIHEKGKDQTFALTKRETSKLDQRPRLNFFRHCLLSRGL